MINYSFMADKVMAAMRPISEQLFQLLRGINAEQEKTNQLLSALVAFETLQHPNTIEHVQTVVAAMHEDAEK